MLIRDPCGIICLIITYIALIYADYVIVKWIVLQSVFNGLWGAFHVVLFNTLLLFSCMAHMKAVTTNPGFVPLNNNVVNLNTILENPPPYVKGCDNIDWTICTKCEIYRPPRAHHCRICKRCIKRMDHHCPWINNCVGERNQKFFIQFLVYISILSIYAMVLIAFTWLVPCENCSQEFTIKQARMMHSVFLLLESVMFGLLVIVILVDQIQSVLTDRTTIEQLQNKESYAGDKSKFALLREVCGTEHPFLWLLPCSNTKNEPEQSFFVTQQTV